MTETLAGAERVSAPLPETPYVGLVPYSESDAAFFFGRDAEKTIITANLRAARLTLVYGPSGVGKTSLLQAGVVHDLREQAVRHATAGRARAPFAIAVCRNWRDDPMTTLMEQIRSSVEEAGGAKLPPWRRGDPAVDTLRGWTEQARRLLVVLDQFEDYFLYHSSEIGEDTFDFQFPLVVNEPNLRVHFLVSIREDAWAKLDRFEGRIPGLFTNYLRVEHLDRDGARDAIEGPVAEYNRRLARGEDEYSVEPELVEAVIDSASAGPDEGANGAAPAGNQVETPFLQLVMERLWRVTVEAGERELTLATLERLGGAQRIVETHLVDALSALDPREQAIAADAFRYLVTRSRRRVVQSVSDLSEWLGQPEAELVPVLEKLASGESGRILRPVPPPPGHESEGARYELFHDVLAEPILEWRRNYEAARAREADESRQRAIRRRLAAIAAGLLVLVFAFAGFAAWALHERGIATRRAAVAQSQSLAARSLREQSLAPRHAVVLAARAEKKSRTPQAEEALRRTLVGWPRPTVLVPAGPTTYGVDFSPDGRFVATAGTDGAVVRSTATGQPVATLVPRKLVYSARFNRDGDELVTAGADGAVRLWRVQGWRELPSSARVLPRLLARAAFTADGRFVVAGGHPGWPNKIWRLRNGRIARQLTARDGVAGWIDPDGTARVVDARTASSATRLADEAPLTSASSPDGKLVLVPAGTDGLTAVLRTATGKLVTTLSGVDAGVFSPDGRRVAAAGPDTVISSIGEGRPHAILSGRVTGGSFSRDGRLFVGASATKRIARVWDSKTGALLAELPPRPPRSWHEVVIPNPYPTVSLPPTDTQGGFGSSLGSGPGPAFELQPSAKFSSDGGLVATWGRPKQGAQLWQPFGTRELARLRKTSSAPGKRLLPATMSADGRLVATATPSNEIGVWRTRDGTRVSTLRGSSMYVSSIAFDAAGDRVAAASFDKSVRVWRVADGSLVHRLRGHTGEVGAVAFSPDGKLIASGSKDETARIWSVRNGDVVHVIEGGGSVASVAFSKDGGSLVTAGGEGTAQIWSTGNWSRRAVLDPGGSSRALIVRAAFGDDGRTVTTLDLDATARIWHSDGGSPIRSIHNVSSVAFNPGGDEIVTGGGDGTARVFHTRDGVQFGPLRGHSDVVSGARFSADGSLIVTAGFDGTARVWQAETGGTVAVVTPSSSEVHDAMLAADGRLVTVGTDGVRVFACEPCLQPDRLETLARKRLAASP